MTSSCKLIKATRIKSIKHLEAVLQCSEKQLLMVIANRDNLYREKLEPKIDKETGKPKLNPDGSLKMRVITPPKHKSLLKALQKRINSQILTVIDLPTCVLGGVKMRDNVLNGKLHQGRKFKFATDLKDFFPSITEEMVYRMFRVNGFSKKVSFILSKLTTWKNFVPQGAPTSTSIANLVFVPIDKRLLGFCEKNGIRYTRWVDDLFFTSKNEFRDSASHLISIIQNSGFKVSQGKTFYTEGNAETTGVKVKNNGITQTLSFKKKMNNLESFSPDQQEGLRMYANKIEYYDDKPVRKFTKVLTKKKGNQ